MFHHIALLVTVTLAAVRLGSGSYTSFSPARPLRHESEVTVLPVFSVIAATGSSIPASRPLLHESEVKFQPAVALDPFSDAGVFQADEITEITEFITSVYKRCSSGSGRPYGITVTVIAGDWCLHDVLCSPASRPLLNASEVKFPAVFHGDGIIKIVKNHGDGIIKIVKNISNHCSISDHHYGITFTGSAENWSRLHVLCSANHSKPHSVPVPEPHTTGSTPTNPTPTNGTSKPSSPPANDSMKPVSSPSLDTSANLTTNHHAHALIADVLWWCAISFCCGIISAWMVYSEYRNPHEVHPERLELLLLVKLLIGMYWFISTTASLLSVLRFYLLFVWEFKFHGSPAGYLLMPVALWAVFYNVKKDMAANQARRAQFQMQARNQARNNQPTIRELSELLMVSFFAVGLPT